MIKWDSSQACKDSSTYVNYTLNVMQYNKRIKHKNHMINSIDTKKVLNKVQYPFMIKKKTSHLTRYGRNVSQHNEDYL
jgi:hypothetical protein